MVSLVLFTLSGKFAVLRKESHATAADAFAAAACYAQENGFSRPQQIDSDDDYTIRVTARTPNGRAGRNVALIEPSNDW